MTANRADFTLDPCSQDALSRLSGPLDAHLRLIESRLGVHIHNRGPRFNVTGAQGPVAAAAALIQELHRVAEVEPITLEQVHAALQAAHLQEIATQSIEPVVDPVLRLRRALIRGRGPRQVAYLQAIQAHDLNFGVGPAGTGKTYLAVAAAVAALEQDRVRRLVLVRPAVEAGERLGFLPGDLAQKIDPYLRPMYDALYELLGFDPVARLMERLVIEVAPLAYMRGRTLNEAFIILDEAQNTTVEQMKMFLTRIGFGSTAVVNGDITQVDLPRGQLSGLRHALQVLDGVEGVSITRFRPDDVVRHPLVQRIVEAYTVAEERESPQALGAGSGPDFGSRFRSGSRAGGSSGAGSGSAGAAGSAGSAGAAGSAESAESAGSAGSAESAESAESAGPGPGPISNTDSGSGSSSGPGSGSGSDSDQGSSARA